MPFCACSQYLVDKINACTSRYGSSLSVVPCKPCDGELVVDAVVCHRRLCKLNTMGYAIPFREHMLYFTSQRTTDEKEDSRNMLRIK